MSRKELNRKILNFQQSNKLFHWPEQQSFSIHFPVPIQLQLSKKSSRGSVSLQASLQPVHAAQCCLVMGTLLGSVIEREKKTRASSSPTRSVINPEQNIRDLYFPSSWTRDWPVTDRLHHTLVVCVCTVYNICNLNLFKFQRKYLLLTFHISLTARGT